MSLIWKLEIGGVKLFTKLSTTEVQCNACDPVKQYKLSQGSTSTLIAHIPKHPAYQTLLKEWQDLEKEEKKKSQAGQRKLSTFFNNGKFLIKNFDIFFRNFVR
jgi:uncharacterized FlgJ-related protein